MITYMGCSGSQMVRWKAAFFIAVSPSIFTFPKPNIGVFLGMAVEGARPQLPWQCAPTTSKGGGMWGYTGRVMPGVHVSCQKIFPPVLDQGERCLWCWWKSLASSRAEPGRWMISYSIFHLFIFSIFSLDNWSLAFFLLISQYCILFFSCFFLFCVPPASNTVIWKNKIKTISLCSFYILVGLYTV